MGLKQLKRGTKEITELAGEAEKFAKRLHPRDEEAAEACGRRVSQRSRPAISGGGTETRV